MAEQLDGPLILQWARRAAEVLHERQAEINRINVFPIPDSDTGSNMAQTMRAAYDSTRRADVNDAAQVTAALASGAVRGARGNSGMVLSQVLRALAEAASRGPVTGEAVARMLAQSVEFVRSSIAVPVEGTVLSVLRSAADAATERVSTQRADLAEVVDRALASAEEALARTPEQLPALAQAGVVDAGGRGLVVILQALHDVLSPDAPLTGPARGRGARRDSSHDPGHDPGHDPTQDPTHTRGAAPAPGIAADSTAAETTDGRDSSVSPDTSASAGTPTCVAQPQQIEVMFFFDASTSRGPAEEACARLLAVLQRLGDSVMLSHLSPTQAMAHVHSTRAGEIIEAAYRLGRVSDLRLEVLPAVPPAEVAGDGPVATAADAAAGGATEAAHPAPAATLPAPDAADATPGADAGDIPLVALAPAGRLGRLFARAGAVVVSPDSSPRRVGKVIHHAVERGAALLVTNGMETTGHDAPAALRTLHQDLLARGVRLWRVHTESFVGGLAALAVHDPRLPVDEVSEVMQDAAQWQRWCDTTPASARADVGALLEQRSELVTVLWTEPATKADVKDLRRWLTREYPEAEFHAYHAPGIPSALQVGVE